MMIKTYEIETLQTLGEFFYLRILYTHNWLGGLLSLF